MPRVVHVVVTENFAGAERYVSSVANITADAGWEVTVVGGQPRRMRDELEAAVIWLPGGTATQARTSVRQAGQFDICHVHMTLAEAIGVSTRRSHRGRLVATRHFAAHRGSTLSGRILAPWIGRRLDAQIAISRFVDGALEKPADAVILNGTPVRRSLWSPESRRVLVLQRLEAEKDTATALRAWKASDLSARGWSLRVVGSGADEDALAALVTDLELDGVDLVSHTSDVDAEFSQAGMLLASAPAEPLGLSVIEAMAAGIPVVAAAGGGHLETIGKLSGSPIFRPGDAAQAGRLLAQLADSDETRRAWSTANQAHQAAHLSMTTYRTSLLAAYSSVLGHGSVHACGPGVTS